MCGIVGIVSTDHVKHLASCNEIIAHRGPDSDGLFTHNSLGLAHQRLSIMDLSPLANQPMFSDDENYVMIFNGEIYNHFDIRAKLKGKYSFRSETSDTETVLKGFIEFGTEVFALMNGIFALAIFDKAKNELTLARDHFGVKPLYYYSHNDELFFGSEIKSFLRIPSWNKEIDFSALTNYLHFLWSPGVQTPFLHVKKMKPGHYGIVDLANPNKISFHEFYNIPFDGRREERSEKEYIDELDQRFTKAVERQMLSDVPVGFFLSGGLDSSLVVAKAREITDKKLTCFTIDTDLDEKDSEGFTNDLQYAKKVAVDLDVNLEVVPAEVNIVEDFDKMIWHLDEPQADAAPLNVLNICKVAREKDYTVLLGGTAGDDLFSGYRRHQALDFEKYFKYVPSFLGKSIAQLTSNLNTGKATFRRIKKITKDLGKPLDSRLAGYYEWLALQTNKSLFSQDVQAKISDYDPSSILLNSLNQIPNEKDPLNHLLYWDMKYFLTDHNLNYTDKLSMAKGVEVRVPFLDVELVNFSTKIPTELKLKGKTTKYLLKKVAEKYLDHRVIYRPKTGFGAPVRKWITSDLDEMIGDYLAPEKIEARGIFDKKKVWQLIENNKKGKVDASYPIWCLLAIESWMRQFVDN